MGFNVNYKAIKLESGNSYDVGNLGNGVTASTVHQVFCINNGSITMTAMGGGTFDWTATSGQYMDIVLGACKVNSGTFIGFKAPSTVDRTQKLIFA